jgi:predicted dehydrogenase/nucleoside-diphosphate-sugar epimerase
MQFDGRPIRVVLIGCGAISQQFHLPVLAGHEGVELIALVDRDLARARGLARDYGVETAVADVGELADGSFDAAVIATPPAHHSPCTNKLARKGIHLLVEKPMALTMADAEGMVRAAEEVGIVLSVGLFRRLLPSMKLFRAALDSGSMGRVIGFDVEFGGPYGWGLATLANLTKEHGGGGVLADMGTHLIDQILYLLPGDPELIEYRDNALGGVETDCELRLRIGREDGPIEGRVGLSRSHELRNTIQVRCDRGTLEWRFGAMDEIAVHPHGVMLCDPASGGERGYRLQASWADQPETNGYEAFRAEFDDWLGAIRTGGTPELDGRSVLPTVRLIEDAYRRAQALREPWVEEGLEGTEAAPGSASRIEFVPRTRRSGKVLVTGAAGFIGCRTVELLRFQEGWDVRAFVHTPGSAARLARLDAEMVQGDLTSIEDVRRVVEGCEAVVHCAVGTAYGDRRKIFDVTVGGTRNLVEAARDAGVRRFVHLSTIAVYGEDPREILDEQTPIRPPQGADYGESKAAAEEVVRRAAGARLSAVILRPGCVYGPFSRTFITRPIPYLMRGNLVLAGCADKPSNTVYVDNLVHAIIQSLDVSPEVANGQAFTIGDGDEWTWGDFYGYFARELGASVRVEPPDPDPAPAGRGPVSWVRPWLRGGATILTSSEFKSLGRKILWTDPVGRFPRSLLERNPGLKRWLFHRLGSEAADIYRRPSDSTRDTIRFRPHPGGIRVDRARALLGYEPPVSRGQAMNLTLEWICSARLA